MMNEFREVFEGQATCKVDRENCVIRDVKITGIVSKNRRNYPIEMLRSKVPLYEGKWVNVDHAPSSISASPRGLPPSNTVRSAADKIGRIKGVYDKPDGLYATEFKYNPKHEFAETMLWWAENDPEALCFSQLVRGPGKDEKDGSVTVEVAEVLSIDIVGSGGTTKGFYESMELTAQQVELIDLGQHVKNLFGDLPADAIKSAIVKAPDKFEGTLAEALASLRDSNDPRVQKLRLELDERLIAEANAARVNKAREACTQAKVPDVLVSEVFIDTLTSADDSKWASLIEDRKKLPAVKVKPTSAGAAPATSDDFVKLYRSRN